MVKPNDAIAIIIGVFMMLLVIVSFLLCGPSPRTPHYMTDTETGTDDGYERNSIEIRVSQDPQPRDATMMVQLPAEQPTEPHTEPPAESPTESPARPSAPESDVRVPVKSGGGRGILRVRREVGKDGGSEVPIYIGG
ncbi:uncharacterized protein TRUGW13939_09961 [Talaromyces rugulosus]|uniref:Uncharacterized protein n=1 Tax=Talaromyces rugulosus TaxID=121627 RepID=A0A7H8R925_TALRU|nr:uncharacterized protein TRUGW13939_09961 [Talaromyces rugulosus]QKX62796.1 hypothetical protein TRUGW13939_09961 [Talaromyces rugulosus]